MKRALLAVLTASAAWLAADAPASAASRVVVDQVAVRFYGEDAAQPRFITARVLAFEARLELMAQDGGGPDQAPEERHVRAAVEHHVAQDILVRLPHEKAPPEAELRQMVEDLRAALEQRVGGRGPIEKAALHEGLDAQEVEELLWREAAAALYIDRALSPVLHPSEEQLREVYRAANHPYRNRRYEEARPLLLRWFVFERLRVAESAFLQSARPRVKITDVRG